MARIEFLRAGPLATVQDLGRYGYQCFGVPTAGAADRYRYRLGNRLLGNADGAAALEYWLMGPEFAVREGAVQIALMGSGGTWTKADGSRFTVPAWRTLVMQCGDSIAVNTTESGAVGYICFAGGIDVPEVMASRSTYVRGKFGGFEGRALANGDVLTVADCPASKAERAWLSTPLEAEDGVPFRVVAGPQAHYFSAESLDRFYSEPFKISPQADRMGKRLVGPTLGFANGRTADIASDAMAHGSIQVPGSGEPIVMLCDRATVGGYAKIGAVITADLPRFARCKPGAMITFQQVGVEEAEAALRAHEENIAAWVAAAVPAG